MKGDGMTGRLLIVEDEPIVALDLQQELEEFGCEVVAMAQSADAMFFIFWSRIS